MYYVCAHTVHANSGPWVSGPRVPGPRSRGLRVPGTVSPCILVVECLLVHVSSLSSVPCLFTHLLGMGFDTFALAYILSRGWNRVQISSTALIWYCIDTDTALIWPHKKMVLSLLRCPDPTSHEKGPMTISWLCRGSMGLRS